MCETCCTIPLEVRTAARSSLILEHCRLSAAWEEWRRRYVLRGSWSWGIAVDSHRPHNFHRLSSVIIYQNRRHPGCPALLGPGLAINTEFVRTCGTPGRMTKGNLPILQVRCRALDRIRRTNGRLWSLHPLQRRNL